MMMEKLSEFKEWKCRIVYLVDRSFIQTLFPPGGRGDVGIMGMYLNEIFLFFLWGAGGCIR